MLHPYRKQNRPAALFGHFRMGMAALMKVECVLSTHASRTTRRRSSGHSRQQQTFVYPRIEIGRA